MNGLFFLAIGSLLWLQDPASDAGEAHARPNPILRGPELLGTERLALLASLTESFHVEWTVEPFALVRAHFGPLRNQPPAAVVQQRLFSSQNVPQWRGEDTSEPLRAVLCSHGLDLAEAQEWPGNPETPPVEVALTYSLFTQAGKHVATVSESLRLPESELGPGFVRRFHVRLEERGQLRLHALAPGPLVELPQAPEAVLLETAGLEAKPKVRKAVILVSGPPGAQPHQLATSGHLELASHLEPGGRARIVCRTRGPGLESIQMPNALRAREDLHVLEISEPSVRFEIATVLDVEPPPTEGAWMRIAEKLLHAIREQP